MSHSWRPGKLIVVVALALLFVAMVHPFVHAITEHGGNDHCTLCQIYLTGALIAAAAFALAVTTAVVAPLRVVTNLSYDPCCLAPQSSRGPPL